MDAGLPPDGPGPLSVAPEAPRRPQEPRKPARVVVEAGLVPEAHRRLQERSVATGVPMASLIRLAVDAYLGGC